MHDGDGEHRPGGGAHRDRHCEGGWGRACELRRPQRLHVSQQVGGVWRGAATKVAVGPMSELTPEQKLRAVQQVRSRRSGLAQES